MGGVRSVEMCALSTFADLRDKSHPPKGKGRNTNARIAKYLIDGLMRVLESGFFFTFSIVSG